jgi:hypothetical protein
MACFEIFCEDPGAFTDSLYMARSREDCCYQAASTCQSMLLCVTLVVALLEVIPEGVSLLGQNLGARIAEFEAKNSVVTFANRYGISTDRRGWKSSCAGIIYANDCGRVRYYFELMAMNMPKAVPYIKIVGHDLDSA